MYFNQSKFYRESKFNKSGVWVTPNYLQVIGCVIIDPKFKLCLQSVRFPLCRIIFFIASGSSFFWMTGFFLLFFLGVFGVCPQKKKGYKSTHGKHPRSISSIPLPFPDFISLPVFRNKLTHIFIVKIHLM